MTTAAPAAPHTCLEEQRPAFEAMLAERLTARRENRNGLGRLGLKLRFGALLVRQFCQPMLWAEGA